MMLRASIYDDDPTIRRLLRVRERINEPGKWVKGCSSDAWGGVCLLHAMQLRATETIITDLTHFIWRRTKCCTIPAFNDARSTTHAVMLKMLDAYIRYHRRKAAARKRKRVPAGMVKIHQLVREIEIRPKRKKEEKIHAV